MSVSEWLPYYQAVSNPKARVFVYHHAGGSASSYQPWAASLPKEIEWCTVQLPGREGRIRHPPLESHTDLLEAVYPVIARMTDVPFVFFGHSMGARVAFELTRLLRRESQPLPLHVFVSGTRAPHLPKDDEEECHTLGDKALVERLREYAGTPESILEHAELMDLMLPTIRADFAAIETWPYHREPPLDVALTALGGLSDPDVTAEHLQQWSEHTTLPFARKMLPGDHFYLYENRTQVLRAIVETML